MRSSTFIVLSFGMNRLQGLRTLRTRRFTALDRAVTYAESVLGRAVGSAVLEEIPDPDAEPLLVKAYGRLSNDLVESLAA